MREYRNDNAHEEVVVVEGAAPHGRSRVTQEGHVGRERERGKTWARGEGRRGKEKKWTDSIVEDRRVFDITGDWSTAALDPVVWHSTVCEGECRFMVAWVREEKKASRTRQTREKRKRRTRLKFNLE